MEKVERFKKAYEHLKSLGKVHMQKDVASAMKVSESNMSAAFKGNERFLTNRFLMRFNKAFGDLFNNKWLTDEEGEMLAPQTGEKELVKINMLNIPIPLETPENAPQGNFSERRRMVERIKLIEPNFKTERPNSISIALSGLVEKSPTQALWVMTGKDDKVVLDRTQYEMMLEKMSLLEKLNKIYREESASDANIIPPSVKHL